VLGIELWSSARAVCALKQWVINTPFNYKKKCISGLSWALNPIGFHLWCFHIFRWFWAVTSPPAFSWLCTYSFWISFFFFFSTIQGWRLQALRILSHESIPMWLHPLSLHLQECYWPLASAVLLWVHAKASPQGWTEKLGFHTDLRPPCKPLVSVLKVPTWLLYLASVLHRESDGHYSHPWKHAQPLCVPVSCICTSKFLLHTIPLRTVHPSFRLTQYRDVCFPPWAGILHLDFYLHALLRFLRAHSPAI
jgi:hypothetical protein